MQCALCSEAPSCLPTAAAHVAFCPPIGAISSVTNGMQVAVLSTLCEIAEEHLIDFCGLGDNTLRVHLPATHDGIHRRQLDVEMLVHTCGLRCGSIAICIVHHCYLCLPPADALGITASAMAVCVSSRQYPQGDLCRRVCHGPTGYPTGRARSSCPRQLAACGSNQCRAPGAVSAQQRLQLHYLPTFLCPVSCAAG